MTFAQNKLLIFLFAALAVMPKALIAHGGPVNPGGISTGEPGKNQPQVKDHSDESIALAIALGHCNPVTIATVDCTTKTIELGAYIQWLFTGQTEPYVATWSTGQTAHKITVVPPGIWSWDANSTGCEPVHFNTEYNQPGSFYYGAIDIQGGPVCENEYTTLTVPQANNYAFVSGAWIPDNPTGAITPYEAYLPGLYQLTVTDQIGCIFTDQIDVQPGSPVLPTISGPVRMCPTGSTEVLSVNQTWSAYLWSTGQTTKSIQITEPGLYEVTVTNQFGCTGIGVAGVLSGEVGPFPITSTSPTINPGQTDTLRVLGGFAQYSWSNGQQGIFSVINTTGTYTVTVTNVYGCTGTASITISSSPWTITPTSRNHTIIIPDTLKFDHLGGSLQPGDWIGVFYDSAATGVLKCGGYGVWSGLSLVFPAYGNDAAPLPQNGFNQGEIFKVKFWRASTNQAFDATVEYAPVGSFNGLITHTNAFADDGISMIRYLSTLARQSIILKNGWNMISSYINPVQPNIEDIMAPVVQHVDIVKNSTGASYIPLLMINGIGNWNTLEGYQVKANQKDTLVIAGQKIDPELNPIALQTGWQIIAYLRDNPMNTDTVFAAIKQHISLVKNNEGKIYAPQFGINEIGNMLPGQGYKVNALSGATLSYRANLREDPVAERKEHLMESEMLHFVLDSNLNTGNNATLILLDSIADLVIDSGDEIGIFTPGNVLCGAAKYQQGENLAITVWGDDSSTSGVVEGMKNAEAYKCKIWDSSAQKECTAMVIFISGQNAYQPDAFEVIQSMMLNHPTDTTITEVACDFYALNNELYFLSGVYTQVLTNVAGCDSTITLNLTINATPIVSVNTPTICAGGTATLTASGATNYVWSTGETTASIQVEPLASATYEVIGITAGCSSAPVNAQVFVTPLPIITLNSDTICNGQSTTLTASGAGSYLWSTGQTGNVIVVNPNETTTYSVIGTSSGCSASMESTVTVDQASADLGNNITLQSGDTITLNAGCNCSSYLWSTGETTSSISVTEMGIYTVTVTGTFGCTATDDVVVMTTGVNNLENAFGIAVFPNPASDIVFITCQKFPVSLIQVVDNQGRVVLQENEIINMGQARQVNVKTLPSGFYHVILSGNGFRYGISVVKE